MIWRGAVAHLCVTLTGICPPMCRFLKYFKELMGIGAGSGNRTRIASLEGWCFTTKLYPRSKARALHLSLLQLPSRMARRQQL